jgi:hypothetical protein
MHMQIDQVNARQLKGIDSGVWVVPVDASSPAARENFGASSLGPAYVREQPTQSNDSFPMYTANGSLRGESGSSGDEALADARAVKSLGGDEKMLRELQQRDAQVRSHESAHVMAAGGQASMPTYSYQTGPDGRRYAIGGSVDISMISSGDSEQSARQAQKAYRAAMAAGEPSSADMQAASRAMNRAMEAKQDEQGERLNAASANSPQQPMDMSETVYGLAVNAM